MLILSILRVSLALICPNRLNAPRAAATARNDFELFFRNLRLIFLQIVSGNHKASSFSKRHNIIRISCSFELLLKADISFDFCDECLELFF